MRYTCTVVQGKINIPAIETEVKSAILIRYTCSYIATNTTSWEFLCNYKHYKELNATYKE